MSLSFPPIPHGASESYLIDSLASFCAQENLPHACALDLLMSDMPNPLQRAWLETFCHAWDAMESRHAHP